MGECMMCLCPLKKEDSTHLKLYVIGSEGITVCRNCRMILTRVAEGVRSQCLAVRHREKMQTAIKIKARNKPVPNLGGATEHRGPAY